MKSFIHILLLIGIVGGIAGLYTACADENDCSLEGRPMMYCTVYTINPDNGAMQNDTLDSLTVTAAGTDSVILNNEKEVHTLMLPLRYTADSTVFIFHYNPQGNPSRRDTLVIRQENTPYFQSMECGYMMEQNIISSRFSPSGSSSQQLDRIDSLYLRNIEANTNEIENLQIFLRYRDRTPVVE